MPKKRCTATYEPGDDTKARCDLDAGHDGPTHEATVKDADKSVHTIHWSVS